MRQERLQGGMRRSPASEPSSLEGGLSGSVHVDGATGGFFDDAEKVTTNVLAFRGATAAEPPTCCRY